MALVIGRFQPLCNHHIAILTELVTKFKPKKILLGVGVSGVIDSRNFLTFDEVKDLLLPVLKQLKVDFEIKAIPDINNPPKYAKHVESIFPQINSKNTQIFTENTYTSDCFIQYGHNYQVITPTILPIRATEIRDLILKKGNWQKHVPPHVAKFLIQK